MRISWPVVIISIIVLMIFGLYILGAPTNEERREYVIAQMETCSKNGGINNCYRNAVNNMLQHFSVREVMSTFAVTENLPEVFSRCHEASHYLGQAAFERSATVAESYSQCNESCHGGCYHGVIEQYFKESDLDSSGLTQEEIEHEVATICGAEADFAAPRTYQECIHGIGHAMMFITGEDLPQALELCDALPAENERETCYGGVFMENSSSSTSLDHPSEYLDPERPLFPCTVLEKRYLDTCYSYQSSYFAELTGWNWPETIKMCLRVPEIYQPGCFRILGTNQVGYSTDVSAMSASCQLVNDIDLRQECIIGVVDGLGGRYLNEPLWMIDFCALTTGLDSTTCYRQMGRTVRSWGREDETVHQACSLVEDSDSARICSS